MSEEVEVTNTGSEVTATTTVTEKGVCPVKQEYLRPALPRITLDAEGKTRGMNKGADRQRSEQVGGTERPSLQGESNFFSGVTLQKIKEAVRESKASGHLKREREGKEGVVEGTKDGEERLLPPASEDLARERIAAQQKKGKELFRDKLVLAPLTTVGNLPFRRVCKSLGADITVSEMALVFNLNRLQKHEWSLLRRHESEDIFGIQVAVAKEQEAVAFAKALQASEFQYDFIDINCGCPVDRIVGFGCGCGLWERRGRLQEVVRGLTLHQSAPVSVKCRIGPDADQPSLHKVVADYESWGASAVTIHGRSRKQRYTKSANWEYTDQCASLTQLPVIGNGDIFAWEDVEQHRREHPHISSFMIGRGALIKPWIFEEIKSGQVKDISSTERLDILKDFCKFGLDHWGADERGVMNTRRFLCEWLSFLHRYVPAGVLEHLPQRINDRPPVYCGRNDLETLMASDSVSDWIQISELLLGPVEEKFRFTPKHKSNAYTNIEGEG